jgi:hypothetical protein
VNQPSNQPGTPIDPGTQQNNESRWVLIKRCTYLDDLKEGQMGMPVRFTSESPYTVISWARFNRLVPSPPASEIFAINLYGSTNSDHSFLTEADAGDQMSGLYWVNKEGPATVVIGTQERYAIEIYTPSIPAVLPADAPPIPQLTGAENGDIDEELRFQRLENAERQREAHERIDSQNEAMAAEKDRRMRESAFGGGDYQRYGGQSVDGSSGN